MVEFINIIRSVPFEPHIGDPTFLGWLTVLAYLAAAVSCVLCTIRSERIFGQGQLLQHRLIWGTMALGLFFLGFNKQLDIQSWFTAVIKRIARTQGWFDLGQQVQIIFIVGLAVVSLVLLIAGIWFFRDVWRHYWLLGLGLIFIARFVIVRAATFYGVSLPELSRFTGGIRINWLLEIGGVFIITLGALLNLRLARTK